MTYSETVQYLYGLQQHGIKLGLETIRALLARGGEPQRQYAAIHIGGTNGKGSTAAMLASMLQAAGHRVGLYTSPHLIDFRERIRVDGVMIPEERVTSLVRMLQMAAASDLAPTFFEFTTALAFHYFAECHVDVAVLEVGLGGRFDATNVVLPMATAITTIGLDHEAYLGSTLEAIAFEKAGIIKPNVPVVIGRLPASARRVIETRAATEAAPLLALDRDFRCDGLSPIDCHYIGLSAGYDHLCCPLEGRFQLDNLACAMALMELARERGLAVPEAAARDGLRQVTWHGRLEVVGEAPTTLLDGAHNPAAAVVLAEYLTEWRNSRPGARVHLIIAMMRDKRPQEFLAPLQPLIDSLIVTQAGLPRAFTGSDLRDVLCNGQLIAHVAATPADALARAKRLASPTDLICVTGSLMLVGEIKALLQGCSLSPIRG
jgi:dihydrofolate synthase/folylpolyglutamate synthase